MGGGFIVIGKPRARRAARYSRAGPPPRQVLFSSNQEPERIAGVSVFAAEGGLLYADNPVL